MLGTRPLVQATRSMLSASWRTSPTSRAAVRPLECCLGVRARLSLLPSPLSSSNGLPSSNADATWDTVLQIDSFAPPQCTAGAGALTAYAAQNVSVVYGALDSSGTTLTATVVGTVPGGVFSPNIYNSTIALNADNLVKWAWQSPTPGGGGGGGGVHPQPHTYTHAQHTNTHTQHSLT